MLHGTPDPPPITVMLYDDAIDPDATVAPEGPVRFSVTNRGEHAHDFLVVRMPEEDATHLDVDGHPVIARLTALPVGEADDLVVELPAGQYVLAGTGSDGGPGESRADLTVQPAETYDVHGEHVPPERSEGTR